MQYDTRVVLYDFLDLSHHDTQPDVLITLTASSGHAVKKDWSSEGRLVGQVVTVFATSLVLQLSTHTLGGDGMPLTSLG
jgi:hypothetical protein